MRIVVLCVAAALLSFAPCSASSAAELELDPRDVLPHAKITLEDAIAKALAKQPGHALAAKLEGEIEDEKAVYYFEVRILTKELRLFEIGIDATSGQVLEVDEEDAQHARALRAGLRHYELSLPELVAKSKELIRGTPVAAKLEWDGDGPECEIHVANGRYLFELDLEGRAGHLLEVELLGDVAEREDEDERRETEERHGRPSHTNHDDEAESAAGHAAQPPKRGWDAASFPVWAPLEKKVTFVESVTHPYFPLAKIQKTVIASKDEKVVRDVLPEKKRIAGILCTVLRETEYEDGKLAEISHNFFAQDRGGNVWYFGETVDDYEDGKVVGHDGAWLVGKNTKEPCLFMPAKLVKGFRFRRENSPPDAVEYDEIAGEGHSLRIGPRTWHNLLVVRETDELGKWQERKYYAKGLGLVSENGELNLVQPDPADRKELRRR